MAINQARPFGAVGLDLRTKLVSESNRSSFLELQFLHEATTLSQLCEPPLDRGMTWSTFSACAPQYWHRWLSRAKMARRDSAIRDGNGTLTKCVNFTTDGSGKAYLSDLNTFSVECRSSALSFKTMTRALCEVTTQRAS